MERHPRDIRGHANVGIRRERRVELPPMQREVRHEEGASVARMHEVEVVQPHSAAVDHEPSVIDDQHALPRLQGQQPGSIGGSQIQRRRRGVVIAVALHSSHRGLELLALHGRGTCAQFCSYAVTAALHLRGTEAGGQILGEEGVQGV